ncbi:response regulator transcription factor [Synechococcus elongatus]|uniref:Response regulator transcription factor n=1 Tax=Synechococcus elongatus PCC 11801 TaxID=2219813 RepID=A0AAN1UTW5_SYNEL
MTIHKGSINVTAAIVHVIEGNPQLRSLLRWHLSQLGLEVALAAGLSEARQLLRSQCPNLIVLAIDLPDGSGLEYCRWLQAQDFDALILMISARSGEADVVAGLQAGADDYLKKPFGLQEFLARVQALLRRQRPQPVSRLEFGELVVDLVQRRVEHRGRAIDLTPQEFSLLYVLVQAQGQPLSRSDLLRRAWPNAIDNPRTVDTHILSLRKKLEQNPQAPQLLQTVRNVGYRFAPDLAPTRLAVS